MSITKPFALHYLLISSAGITTSEYFRKLSKYICRHKKSIIFKDNLLKKNIPSETLKYACIYVSNIRHSKQNLNNA